MLKKQKNMNEIFDFHKNIVIKTNGTSDCGSIFTYALDNWGEIQELKTF